MDNFEHIILETDLTKEKADERERYYIKYYNSIDNGYNLTIGGEGGTPSEEVKEKIRKKAKDRFNNNEYSERMKEIRRTPEYREKLSKMMHSDEYKQILHDASSGKNNPMYGRHHTEEAKAKMREYHKLNPHKGVNSYSYGKHHSDETKRKIGEASKGRKSAVAKQVICCETNDLFNSVRECSDKMHINYSSIRYCCQQNSKDIEHKCSTHGYHFYYVV